MTVNDDQAEAPLEPDPAWFDPMREPSWTLAMAVAWVQGGSADAVREEWNTWCAQYSGRREISLEVLIASSTENRRAWNTLQHALQEGRITAMGIRANSKEKAAVPIPADEWYRLINHPTGPDLVEKFRYAHTSKSPEHGYDEILLKRDDVLQLALAAGAIIKPPREKKRRGRPPKHTPHCEAAARRIVENAQASKAPFGKGNSEIIQAFQSWYERAHPSQSKPVRSTVEKWFTMWGL